MTEELSQNNTEQEEEKSFFKVIIHSFFIIPFLIAVFCVLLFTAVNLLTRENRTAYDYLEDVKTGGLTKRWQGAFELSRIIANSKITDQRFTNELIQAFEQARHDDNRVRQYLALAMGRTGNKVFIEPLVTGLSEEKEQNLSSLIYALGMLADKRTASSLYQYLDHRSGRIRSITVVALGNMYDRDSIPQLQKALLDQEANVQWGAAISLARLGNGAGKTILLSLLNREYFNNFEQVDPQEQNHLILSAIEASQSLNDRDLLEAITQLSKNDKNMKVRSSALKVIQ